MTKHRHRPTRREQLALTSALLRGAIAGATHTLLTWILEHLTG